METKLLVIQAAALGHDLVRDYADLFAPLGLDFSPLTVEFPAVTCVSQATFRTASGPAEHGIVCNGIFRRDSRKADFWNQSAHLVEGTRIWDDFRRRGGRVGITFWQQSLGERADVVLNPAPIHKHHGGMIQALYSQPPELEATLTRLVGHPFNLMRYWGPLASKKSSEWIAAALSALLGETSQCPDLLLTYLPHLDYVLQKYGPGDRKRVGREIRVFVKLVQQLLTAARRAGYEVLVWGDYGIEPAQTPVYPNRILREKGLLNVRRIGGGLYPDLYTSKAFAMVDHQVAHLYVPDEKDVPEVKSCLEGIPGVEAVLAGDDFGAQAGELVLRAAPSCWFAYPWWEQSREAPDYASHVDIHNKPGFDPCELFFGFPPPSVSQDASRVRGTHGRNSIPAAYAWSNGRKCAAASLRALAAEVRSLLAKS